VNTHCGSFIPAEKALGFLRLFETEPPFLIQNHQAKSMYKEKGTGPLPRVAMRFAVFSSDPVLKEDHLS
jgi:hypothetical protein